MIGPRSAITRVGARAALLLAAGALCLMALAPAAGEAAEAGVNLNTLSPGGLEAANALGAKWIRVFVPWGDIEPARGQHAQNWLAEYDRVLASLPRGGHAIFDVVGAPSWESGSSAGNAPPASDADYAALLHFLAARWAGRVSAYEIWNEEDASRWWSGAPDPAAYTRLLQSAYSAVKTADPAATVVLGGLTGNDYAFLQGVYAAGGKGYFDAVGVHTDTACNVASPETFLRDPGGRLDQDSFLAYREVHATELANGDEKPIWMTETSWRTTTATCPEGAWAGQKPEGVSEPQQADYLDQAYHCLAEDPYVQVALWYPLSDSGPILSGLVRANGTHKPAYAAMQAYLAHGDQQSGVCGDFAGPKITLQAPSDGARYRGILHFKALASDPVGIRHISLYYDGHLIRNWVPYFHTHTYPQSTVAEMGWFGAMKISPGVHKMTVFAIDKLENTSTIHFSIVHLGEHPRGHHRRRRHKHRRHH